MSQNQQLEVSNILIESGLFIYSINEEEKTASIYDYYRIKIKNVIIPSTIIYKSKEYIVTKISKNSLGYSDFESIDFEQNSQLKTIEKFAFYFSKIKILHFPSSLIELKEGWCKDTAQLTQIHIMPNNQNFILFNDKYIVERNQEDKTYDKLIFASRSITLAHIPSFIKQIGPYAFDNCKLLEGIQISDDSKLQSINKYAFYNSSIINFTIPHQIIKIETYSFAFCHQLQYVNIPIECNLKTIEKDSFYKSSIKNINIPTSCIELNDGWCQDTPELTNISVSPYNLRYKTYYDNKLIIGKSSMEQDNYDVLVFCVRNIEEIIIPSFIEIIGNSAFDNCRLLRKVEIPCNSKLRIIGKHAFKFCAIENFLIPSHLTKICEGAFSACQKLKFIELPDEPKLQTIENEAFTSSAIETISIPSSCVELMDNWCDSLRFVTKILVSPDNPRYSLYNNDKFIIGKSYLEKENFDVLVFCVKNVKTVTIPNFIEIIGCQAFSYCTSLYQIKIPNDTKLRIIENSALSCCCLESFSIPSSLIKIGKYAFDSYKPLKRIEILADSKLQIIDDYGFATTDIDSISIPPNVMEIGTGAFGSCQFLQIIELVENSKMKSFNNNVFEEFFQTIVMIPSNLKILVR